MENISLADRIDDIEKTIGDLVQVFDAFKQVLIVVERPTCPPWCAHGVDNPDEDDLLLPERVEEIKKWIADYGRIFDAFKDALDDARRPTCPPYCAHEVIPDPEY